MKYSSHTVRWSLLKIIWMLTFKWTATSNEEKYNSKLCWKYRDTFNRCILAYNNLMYNNQEEKIEKQNIILKDITHPHTTFIWSFVFSRHSTSEKFENVRDEKMKRNFNLQDENGSRRFSSSDSMVFVLNHPRKKGYPSTILSATQSLVQILMCL